MLLDDARLVFRPYVRERDEISLQEAQPVIVIAKRKRLSCFSRQLAHEAKRARIAALHHLVEDDVLEVEPPWLALFACQLDFPFVALPIDVGDAYLIGIGVPSPVDDVA